MSYTPTDQSPPQPTGAALAAAQSWQPPGLFLLFFVEMWERFSYYGMRALLVLYLIATVHVGFNLTLADGSSMALESSARVRVTLATGAVVEGEIVASDANGMTIKGETKDGDKTIEQITQVAQGDATSVEVVNHSNGGRGWATGEATLLYGWYTGLAYLLPIMGGLIADKFIGTHRSMLVGGISIALGHVALAVSGFGEWANDAVGLAIFIGGLALIVIGTGHFKPCVSVMVGQLYPRADDPRREGGYSIFYMGINVGAFICAFICGTLGEKVGWHWGFGAAAVGMVLGLVMYVIGRPRFLQGVGLPPEGKPNISIPLLVGAVILATAVGFFFYEGGFTWLRGMMTRTTDTLGYGWTIALILAAMLALTGWLLSAQDGPDRPKVLAILVFILFNTFFWMAFEQAGSTLNVFALENTNRSMGSWEMPATWFQSVNPLLIIALSIPFALMWPWLAKRRMKPRQAGKIGIGLILLGIGYLFMVFGGGAASTGVKVSVFWLLATYFFHTLGELFLSPTGLSFVTKTAPLKFVSLLMGIWFLSSFAAGVLGGLIGSYVEKVDKGEVTLPWTGVFGGQGDFFFLFVLSSIGAGVLCIALGPILNRMSREA